MTTRKAMLPELRNDRSDRMPAAELSTFQKDFEAAKASCRAAQEYLEAEDVHAKAAETMRQTWKQVMECGAALKRMHDSGNYLVQFGSWNALCLALNIQRTTSYRLMRRASQTSSPNAGTGVKGAGFKPSGANGMSPMPRIRHDDEGNDENESCSMEPSIDSSEAAIMHGEALIIHLSNRVPRTERLEKVLRKIANLLREYMEESARDTLRSRIAKLLAESSGMTIGSLAKQTNAAEAEIAEALSHAWFIKAAGNYYLSTTGRQQAV